MHPNLVDNHCINLLSLVNATQNEMYICYSQLTAVHELYNTRTRVDANLLALDQKNKNFIHCQVKVKRFTSPSFCENLLKRRRVQITNLQRGGGRFYSSFTRSSAQNAGVKKLSKFVQID